MSDNRIEPLLGRVFTLTHTAPAHRAVNVHVAYFSIDRDVLNRLFGDVSENNDRILQIIATLENAAPAALPVATQACNEQALVKIGKPLVIRLQRPDNLPNAYTFNIHETDNTVHLVADWWLPAGPSAGHVVPRASMMFVQPEDGKPGFSPTDVTVHCPPGIKDIEGLYAFGDGWIQGARAHNRRRTLGTRKVIDDIEAQNIYAILTKAETAQRIAGDAVTVLDRTLKDHPDWVPVRPWPAPLRSRGNVTPLPLRRRRGGPA